jgi:GNAT superfamily N-acetyltransferase
LPQPPSDIVDRSLATPEFQFSAQSRQYPRRGPRGISYFAGTTESDDTVVDCLLFRDKHGILRGILNYYATSIPPFETAGSVNIFVEPRFQRKGIATKLLRVALDRWPTINLDGQTYSTDGKKFITRFREATESAVV